MSFYWIKTNWLIKKLFSNFVWHVPGKEKTIYLTFDDGPTPEITEWVLDVLKKHNVKATFFCIGNNIEKHPNIFQKVIDEGHAVGNHTYNHLNGWKSDNSRYLNEVAATEDIIASKVPYFLQNKLFRPPYGKIKASQAAALLKQDYRIIMWDVLSADFDQEIESEKCLQNVVKNTCPGSIIIFHDSVKAYNNLRYTLPKAIEYLKEKEFRFGTI